MQKIHSQLTGLYIDSTLVADLLGHYLLTSEECREINLQEHNPVAAGIYFVNSVLMRWLYEVFESNVYRFIEVLQHSDDIVNQKVARDLQLAFQRCK